MRSRWGSIYDSKQVHRLDDGSISVPFGTKPQTIYISLLEKVVYLELDTSPELDIKGVKIYQSMIGATQWVVSQGRLDVATGVVTL